MAVGTLLGIRKMTDGVTVFHPEGNFMWELFKFPAIESLNQEDQIESLKELFKPNNTDNNIQVP